MTPIRLMSALLVTLLLAGNVTPALAGGLVSDSAGQPRAASRPATSELPRSRRIRKGHVIVQLRGATTASKLERVYDSADTSAGAVSVLGGEVLKWRVPAGMSEARFAEQLEASGLVAYAEPDYNRQLADTFSPPAYVAPNESAFTSPTIRAQYQDAKAWWLRDIKAPEMWQAAYGPVGPGRYPLRADRATITVAVLDTGFWLEGASAHPDGVANVVKGWDTYSNDSDVTPPDYRKVAVNKKGKTPARILDEQVRLVSHGTNVAGLVGAQVANGVGSFGSGYDTRVKMYKVAGLDSEGWLTIPDSAVISALDRASLDGCKVISMSFVGTEDSAALRAAVDRAYKRGCILVAARGNDSNKAVQYPAGWPNVVGIGALAKSSTGSTVKADFSSYGTGLDLSAPGDEIWGLTHPSFGESATEPGYDYWSGTSMATPIVAGALALLWRAAPNLSADEVVGLAQDSATNLYTPGRDDYSGYGELNLATAYARLTARYPLLRGPAVSLPTTPSVRGIPVTWSPSSGYLVRYDVALDGMTVATGLSATTTPLPAMTSGDHTVTVTAKSLRNWSDAGSVTSKPFSAAVSIPFMLSTSFDGTALRWTSTEPAAGRSYRLAIDGRTPATTLAEKLDASTLSLGIHTAAVSVVDSAAVMSQPLTRTFRAWPAPSVVRVSGLDRYSANTALSRSEFTSASTVVLVSGETWPDALSASPLARKLNAPVLLTRKGSLVGVTATELKRLKAKNVVIVGGSGSVSPAVVTALKSRGLSVRRIWGPDRYSTADAVARELYRLGPKAIPGRTALVASGDTHRDALIASAVGARMGWPVLLTRRASVSAGTLSTLRSLGVTGTVVVGTTTAISSAAAAQLPEPTRVSASGSSAMSVAVANWAIKNHPGRADNTGFFGERFFVASNASTTYADSLGVGAVAGRHGGLLLLTTPTLAPEVSAYYKAHPADATVTRVVGGPATLPQPVITAIKSIVGAP